VSQTVVADVKVPVAGTRGRISLAASRYGKSLQMFDGIWPNAGGMSSKGQRTTKGKGKKRNVGGNEESDEWREIEGGIDKGLCDCVWLVRVQKVDGMAVFWLVFARRRR
jgi:hypothetical protein